MALKVIILTKESWIEWYDKVVKRNSVDSEDELRRCKEELELFWEMSREKTWNIEDLIDDIQNDDVEADERSVGDALYYLTQEMRCVLPVYDWLAYLLEEKEHARSNFEDSEKFAELAFAFQRIVLNSSFSAHSSVRGEFQKIIAITDREARESAFSNFLAEKNFERMAEEQESLFHDKLKTYVLPTHLLIASMLVESISKLMGDPLNKGRSATSGILMRSLLDVSFKGMLYEHLMRTEFRIGVETGEGYTLKGQKVYLDTVKGFVEEIKRMRSKTKTGEASFGESLRKYNLGELQKIRDPSFPDILRWLVKWNVFEPLPNAEEGLRKTWNSLSSDAHPNFKKTLFLRLEQQYVQERLLAPEYAPVTIFEEMKMVLDVILLGAFSTARNVERKRFQETMNTTWSEGLSIPKSGFETTVWRKLVELAGEAGFSLLSSWLESNTQNVE